MTTRRAFITGVAAMGGVAALGFPVPASSHPVTPNPLERIPLDWLQQSVVQLDLFRWLGHSAAYDFAMRAFAQETEPDRPAAEPYGKYAVIAYHNNLRPSERRWGTEGVQFLVEIGRRGQAWPDLPDYTHEDGSSFRAYLIEFNRNHAFGYGPWLRRRFNERRA